MSENGPDLSRLLEILLQLATFVIFVWGAIHSLPTATSLSSVLAASIACSVISGITWAVLVRVSFWLPLLRPETGYAGGSVQAEPNGLESLVWSLVVFGPVLFVAARMQGDAIDHKLRSMLSLLVGFALGAFAFYGGGIRGRIERYHWNYVNTEIWIGVLWALSLAIPAFCLFEFAKLGLRSQSIYNALLRSGSFVVLVWLPITVFVTLVNTPAYAFVRGVVGGLCLEFATLSITLASAERARAWGTQLLEALGVR